MKTNVTMSTTIPTKAGKPDRDDIGYMDHHPDFESDPWGDHHREGADHPQRGTHANDAMHEGASHRRVSALFVGREVQIDTRVVPRVD